MEGGGTSMIAAVTDALSTVIDWIGTVVTAVLSGPLSALLPLFAIGIAISAFLLGIKAIKSTVWGT